MNTDKRRGGRRFSNAPGKGTSNFQLRAGRRRSILLGQQDGCCGPVRLGDDPELNPQSRVVDGKDLGLAERVALVAAGRGVGLAIVRCQVAPLAAEVLEEEMRRALSRRVQGRQCGRRGDDLPGGELGAVGG